MSNDDAQEYGRKGHLKLERGGLDHRGRRRSMIRTPEEIALDDRMRRRFTRLQTPSGGVPSRAIQEIREGRQAPWRANARRVLELMDANVSVVLGEMATWIDDIAAARRLDPAA